MISPITRKILNNYEVALKAGLNGVNLSTSDKEAEKHRLIPQEFLNLNEYPVALVREHRNGPLARIVWARSLEVAGRPAYPSQK